MKKLRQKVREQSAAEQETKRQEEFEKQNAMRNKEKQREDFRMREINEAMELQRRIRQYEQDMTVSKAQKQPTVKQNKQATSSLSGESNLEEIYLEKTQMYKRSEVIKKFDESAAAALQRDQKLQEQAKIEYNQKLLAEEERLKMLKIEKQQMRETEQQMRSASVSAGINLKQVVQNQKSNSSGYLSSSSSIAGQNDSGGGAGALMLLLFLSGSFLMYQYLNQKNA